MNIPKKIFLDRIKAGWKPKRVDPFSMIFTLQGLYFDLTFEGHEQFVCRFGQKETNEILNNPGSRIMGK